MAQIVGTCGICGGRVTRDFDDQHPLCNACGAKAVLKHGPRLPMVAPAREVPALKEASIEKVATLSLDDVGSMMQKEGR